MNRHVRLTAALIICLLTAPLSAAEMSVCLLHLPGIGGHRRIDDALLFGLEQGKIDARIEIYDWTNGNPGVPALAAVEHNRAEAKKISARIIELARATPQRRIILTSHSGGTGIAVWALEDLPDDVMVDSLLMIASALSPQYDLTKALRHVRGRAYTFNSTFDVVLNFGTRGFGTIDRLYMESAGFGGFSITPTSDPKQYDKLVQIPYDPAWMILGHAGGHIGAMNRAFARTIVAPLLLTGELPKLPTTQPATMPAMIKDN